MLGNFLDTCLIAMLLLCYKATSWVNAAAAVSSHTTKQQGNVGKISDIHVDVNLYENQILQLQVSWKDNLSNDTSYNIMVNSLNSTLCPEIPCSMYGIAKPKRAIFVPENPMIGVEPECSYMFGCNYTLTVETSNALIALQRPVSIPHCVMGVCSCEHSALPMLEVNASMPHKNTILFNWSFKLTEEQTQLEAKAILYKLKLSTINIEISEQSNPSLSWGGYLIPIAKKTYSFHNIPHNKANDTLLGQLSIQLDKELSPKAVLHLLTYMEDELHCSGLALPIKAQVPDYEASKLKPLIEEDHKLRTWLIVTVSSLGIVTVLLFSYCIWHRKREKLLMQLKKHERFMAPFTPVIEMQDNINYVEKEIEDAQTKGLADIFEVPHSAIRLGPEIGEGAFGRVYKAIAVNLRRMRGNTVVAVKQMKKNPTKDEIKEFLLEIEMLKGVGTHHNIVCFLGCCTIKQPYLIVMEFVGRGDLLTYLRRVRYENNKFKPRDANYTRFKPAQLVPAIKYTELKRATYSVESLDNDEEALADEGQTRRPKPSVAETTYTIVEDEDFQEPFEYILSHKELHNFALQIANGMRFLEEQEIIHRDLAARNVLIDDRKTLKITDFGLSRHGIYTNTKTRKLPLRWLSIEAICDNYYSSKSDVWAYGVVLWEIGTLGATPYPNVSNQELLPNLLAGKRLCKPDICTDQVYALMLRCWDEDYSQRPTFEELYRLLSPKTAYVDINSLSDDYVFPPIKDI